MSTSDLASGKKRKLTDNDSEDHEGSRNKNTLIDEEWVRENLRQMKKKLADGSSAIEVHPEDDDDEDEELHNTAAQEHVAVDLPDPRFVAEGDHPPLPYDSIAHTGSGHALSGARHMGEPMPPPPVTSAFQKTFPRAVAKPMGKPSYPSTERYKHRTQRVEWTPDLHQKFLEALAKLGDRAVPKAIIEEMNVPFLTREKVASHLQKYRQSVEKQHQMYSTRKLASWDAAGGMAPNDSASATSPAGSQSQQMLTPGSSPSPSQQGVRRSYTSAGTSTEMPKMISSGCQTGVNEEALISVGALAGQQSNRQIVPEPESAGIAGRLRSRD